MPRVPRTFATIRLRTTKTKGYPSARTALSMVFSLWQSVERRRHRLGGAVRFGEVARGVRFVDGEPHIQNAVRCLAVHKI